MDLDSLTQKSHTLIVIDEDQVVSCDEVVGEEVPVGQSVFVFFRSFVGIANDEIYPFKKPSIPALSQLAKTEKNQRTDPPSALLSSNFSHISGYPTCVTWLLL